MIYRPSMRRRVPYGALTTIELIIDASGLATNTNNSYGTVDGSNVITAIKSVAPGPTGRDFSVIGSGVTFDPTTKSIAFNGSGRLRSTGAASVYDFLSYNGAGVSSLVNTVYVVCKIGTSLLPSAAYGIYGNNGGSSANKGAVLTYGNTAGESSLQSFVSKGSSGFYPARLLVPGIAPSNQYCVITIRVDGAGTRMVQYVNDQAILYANGLQNDNAPVTTPTYALEIGGAGNSVAPLIGNIKEVIMCRSASSNDVALAVIRGLMNKHNITRIRTADSLNTSKVYSTFDADVSTSGFYYLSAVVGQNPTNKNQFFTCYTKGTTHGYGADKKLVGRISNSPMNFATSSSFGTEFTIYDPANPLAVQEAGGGFDQNGIFHIFTDSINSGSAGGCVDMRHIYSSDLSSWTNTDITSVIPSDGLAAWRSVGNMIHANGIWVKPYYKAKDHGDPSESANYILRSTNGTTWTSVTVRAKSSSYYNEGSVAYLGGDSWLIIVRDEVTLEWRQFYSSDNALTWTNQGAITFGESITVSANPMMLKTFTHNGVLVVAAYITNRDADTAYVIYGKASSIISSGLSGWDLDTKFMWWKTSAPAGFTAHFHYGDVAHINNSLEAISVYPYDTYPAVGGTANGIYLNMMPTFHVAKIESELAI